MSLIGILSEKPRLSNILKEIAFTSVFTSQFSWSLVEGVGIAVGVDEDLETGLHFFVIEMEDGWRVVDVGALIAFDEDGVEGRGVDLWE